MSRVEELSQHWYWKLGGARVWVADRLNLKPGMRVLDVGGGDGGFSIQAGSKYGDVDFVGVEYSGECEEAIENIDELGLENVEFHYMDAFNMRFENEFDRVVFFISLRNIPINKIEMPRLFKEVSDVLRTDGLLAIAEMFKEDAENEAQRLAQRIYEECSRSIEDDGHHRGIEVFFSVKEVESALQDSGFDILSFDKFKTGVRLSVEESMSFIRGEVGHEHLEDCWKTYGGDIESLGGLEPDANISLIIAKKKPGVGE